MDLCPLWDMQGLTPKFDPIPKWRQREIGNLSTLGSTLDSRCPLPNQSTVDLLMQAAVTLTKTPPFPAWAKRKWMKEESMFCLGLFCSWALILDGRHLGGNPSGGNLRHRASLRQPGHFVAGEVLLLPCSGKVVEERFQLLTGLEPFWAKENHPLPQRCQNATSGWGGGTDRWQELEWPPGESGRGFKLKYEKRNEKNMLFYEAHSTSLLIIILPWIRWIKQKKLPESPLDGEKKLVSCRCFPIFSWPRGSTPPPMGCLTSSGWEFISIQQGSLRFQGSQLAFNC